MRFRPEQHLRRQSDFRVIREQGRRVNCGSFTLWGLRRAASPSPAPAEPAEPAAGAPAAEPAPSAKTSARRVGVVASTVAVGHAVRRNRAKRRLREIFRRHQEEVPVGCDVLLSARAAAVDAPMPELEHKFVDACRKVFSPKNA
ncbi:ribonuclease P protein component [Opitutus terrae]|uniref:Ribonuclease P protein component n=1 Tax=Opitutus terrae (strain DSM 11246 / JCM 15787 / PB90-1) TaxID=452637 RepID=B1ZSR4_OPITP|nr:ribonuclease P protein component [Opitutus terrae]ACB74758.1 ribonuclease P protein component [Opitutus terrae PB90-1]